MFCCSTPATVVSAGLTTGTKTKICKKEKITQRRGRARLALGCGRGQIQLAPCCFGMMDPFSAVLFDHDREANCCSCIPTMALEGCGT